MAGRAADMAKFRNACVYSVRKPFS